MLPAPAQPQCPTSLQRRQWTWDTALASGPPVVVLREPWPGVDWACLKNIHIREKHVMVYDGRLGSPCQYINFTAMPLFTAGAYSFSSVKQIPPAYLWCSHLRIRVRAVHFSPDLLFLHSGPVVKARDKYRHPECFVCADCNLNLKQKGYFFVEGELYCETHARARTRPPEGYDTVALYPRA